MLGARLNQIISEQKLTKAEFAKRVGITENCIYILTGKRHATSSKEMKLSSALAKLIALEFGYDEHWIMTGKMTSEE
jgi:predicted transcriptional regulator